MAEDLTGHTVVLKYGKTGALSARGTFLRETDHYVVIETGWKSEKWVARAALVDMRHARMTCRRCGN